MNQNEDKIVASLMEKHIPPHNAIDAEREEGHYHCEDCARWVRQHCEDALRECISLAREWIPVSERLPEDKVQVILWSSHGWATVGELRRYFRDEEWSFKNHADFPSECFTHWQPITPPTDERTREGSGK